MINGHCVKCPDNCSNCDASGCTSCDSRYGLVNGACVKCPDNCSNCNASGCTSCNSRYGLVNGACVKCPDNCYSCGADGCTSCNSGYGVKNGNCARCADPNCTRCESAYNKCFETGCKSGYYKAENGVCIPKVTGVTFPHCTIVSGNGTKCERCASGYTQIDGECVEGTACPSGYTGYVFSNSANNYHECTKWGDCRLIYQGTGGRCSACKDGSYLLNGSCVKECGEGYIEGMNITAGTSYTSTPVVSATCIPEGLGCGYGEKQVGNKCVARDDDENCGNGFLLEDGLCIPIDVGCSDEYIAKDGVCIDASLGCGENYRRIDNWCNRVQWTPAEAAAVLTDDNNNSVTITFKK